MVPKGDGRAITGIRHFEGQGGRGPYVLVGTFSVHEQGSRLSPSPSSPFTVNTTIQENNQRFSFNLQRIWTDRVPTAERRKNYLVIPLCCVCGLPSEVLKTEVEYTLWTI
ncbi:hypothetical protein ABG768_012095 [Culter alburnus]|uniref:Uncharacterized protein n=1 Tax=Culter alburnus TaxID=194366 RepID=A0AAW1Z8V8_CULAL